MLRKLMALRMVVLLCWALSPAWAGSLHEPTLPGNSPSRGALYSRAGTLGPAPSEFPEPAAWLLIGGGLLAAGALRRRRPGSS